MRPIKHSDWGRFGDIQINQVELDFDWSLCCSKISWNFEVYTVEYKNLYSC